MKLYFDIDTQIDFMFPAGALYVPGAEKLLPLIAMLNRQAVANGGRVISTTDAHREDDAEFRQWPPHCVAGTVGQTKPITLLLEKRAVVPVQEGSFAIPGAEQIILEKTQLDLFTNPATETILRAVKPEECIVYGVVTEYCVRHCAMGLLDRGYKVSLVREAIQCLDGAVADGFLRDFGNRPGASFYRQT